MTYLQTSTYNNLQEAFKQSQLSLKIKDDHVLVENSKALSAEKIYAIVKSTGFSPLTAVEKNSGNFAFSLVPYKAPFSSAISIEVS